MSETTGQEQPTGDIVRRMREVRDERRRISERDKELVTEWRDLESKLLLRLDDQDMEKATVTGVGTASITTKTLPQVVDWDAFYAYMQENDALYLLQRRVATSAWNELRNSNVAVPGIEAYEQRSISLRNK